jgi:large subunit ribosomal protein L19e
MVNLKLKRKLAAKVLGVGVERVWFDPEALEDLEGVDTREDVRALEAKGVIRVLPVKGQTRREKGRKGPGSRKGKKTVKVSKKERWMMRVRAQRRLLRTLRGKGAITPSQYRRLYSLVKGGMFKSKARLSDYIESNVMKIKTETR